MATKKTAATTDAAAGTVTGDGSGAALPPADNTVKTGEGMPLPENSISVVTFSFDEFVGYGKCVQPHLGPGGTPWSWQFYDNPVTHETDDHYVVAGRQFKRGDALTVTTVVQTGQTTVTFEIITPEDAGFENCLRSFDKAQDRIASLDTQIDAPNYEVIYGDHNGVEVYAATHSPRKGHDYIVGVKDQGALLGIEFQCGPIKEVGVNGVQNEHLLAVLIHRTNILNDQFPCDENVLAIRAMKQAINAFQSRTANRQARGVEGENKL